MDSKRVKDQQVAKARRAIAQEGKGGVRARKGAKRSEQKSATSGLGFGSGKSLNFDRRPKSDAPCGCGSGKAYSSCCAPKHDCGTCESTEELVRARFTAFKYRLPDFLMLTTDPQGAEYNADATAWKKSLLAFCDVSALNSPDAHASNTISINFLLLANLLSQDFEFQTLQIGEVEQVPDDAIHARVAFRANFVQKGTINLLVLCEQSTFRRVDGKWLYADGQVNYEAQSV